MKCYVETVDTPQMIRIQIAFANVETVDTTQRSSGIAVVLLKTEHRDQRKHTVHTPSKLEHKGSSYVDTVDTKSMEHNTFSGMHVDTVDTKSMEHITFNDMHVDTVDTSFELHFLS